VGTGHTQPLYLPGTSPLHRARPQCKLAAAFLFEQIQEWRDLRRFPPPGIHNINVNAIGPGVFPSKMANGMIEHVGPHNDRLKPVTLITSTALD
jgi:hypothetical protein